MSVTFQCPGAPTETIPCPFCGEPWAEFPEGNGKGGKCDSWCTGSIEQSVAPEANFANENATALLRILGFTVDCCGDLYGSCDAATMRQRILKARNSDRSTLLVDPSTTPGGWAGTRIVRDDDGMATIQRMGPTIIRGGNTDEQTMRRLSDLEAVALWAQEHGSEIVWG